MSHISESGGTCCAREMNLLLCACLAIYREQWTTFAIFAGAIAKIVRTFRDEVGGASIKMAIACTAAQN